MITEVCLDRFPDPFRPQPTASRLAPAVRAALEADGFPLEWGGLGRYPMAGPERQTKRPTGLLRRLGLLRIIGDAFARRNGKSPQPQSR